MQPQGVEKYIKHWEPRCFYLIAALHLVPLLALQYFPTVDGAAHVYNAQILNGLLSGSELYNRFYEFNPVPEPNWLGQAIISLFSFVFSPLASEKIFLALYIIALPLSFRRLVLQLNPDGGAAAWLIFPFIYSFTFISGFYNFCIGLPLLLIAVTYWLKVKDRLQMKHCITLALLFIALYFAHLLVFVIMGMIALLTLLPSITSKGFKYISQKTFLLLIASLPALALTAAFFYFHYSSDPGFSFDTGGLLKLLANFHPVMTYDYEQFSVFAKVMLWVLAALLILTLALRLRARNFLANDVWLAASFIMLALYFILPDSTSGGGFISVRLSYFFFLFLAVWIAANTMLNWMKLPAAAVSAIASLGFLFSFDEKLSQEDLRIQEYLSVSRHIETGAIVLPLNYEPDWRESHLSNYLGYEKELIILENYEASSGLFPVLWKQGLEPLSLMGDIVSRPPCADMKNYEQRAQPIDYIVQWKEPASSDACTENIRQHIRENYMEVFRSEGGNAVLFKRKGNIAVSP